MKFVLLEFVYRLFWVILTRFNSCHFIWRAWGNVMSFQTRVVASVGRSYLNAVQKQVSILYVFYGTARL